MIDRAVFVGLLAAGALVAAAWLLPARPVAAAPGTPYAEGLVAKKLILAIGIDRFQDPLWHGLNFARQDARSVYAFFMAKEVGFDGGELLAGGDGVTAGAATAALQRLDHENRNEDDTVVIYLSMHGTVAYRPDGRIGRYIITTDTDSQNVAKTSVDYDQLMAAFQKLRSRRKVLILAFCHSGVGKSALTPEMKRALAQIKGPYFDEPIQERSEGSIILTASGWQEPALEDAALGGDVYTHFLLEGLRLDNGGLVTITSAHEYAAQKTYDYTQGRQRPSAIVELLGADPIVVKGDPVKRHGAMLYSLMRRFANLQVFIDGQPKGTLEKGLALPEGKARVRLEDPQTGAVVADRAMTFRAGKEYSVGDMLTPRLDHSLLAGAAVQGFVTPAVRSQFAPRDSLGGRLRYRQDEALGLFDLGIDGAYFPAAGDTIRLPTGDLVAESRRSAVLSATLVDRQRLGLLSTSLPGVLTETHLGLGPSVLYVERRLDEPALRQRQGQYVSPGLVVDLGLDWTFPYYLLRVGVDGEWGAYRNFSTTPGILSVSRLVGLSLGTFW